MVYCGAAGRGKVSLFWLFGDLVLTFDDGGCLFGDLVKVVIKSVGINSVAPPFRAVTKLKCISGFSPN